MEENGSSRSKNYINRNFSTPSFGFIPPREEEHHPQQSAAAFVAAA
jgi:hypothetical protein